MTVKSIRVCGGVKRSADYQSTDCSFEVEVSLESTDNAKAVMRDIYRSMMAQAHIEAQDALHTALQIRREVEGI